jgi:hypothetical protein
MKNNSDAVEVAISNMFKQLPPEVAERVRAKYEADRSEFLEHVKSNTPSNSPGFWAVRSCTKCHGRGIIGELTKPGGGREPLVCHCVSKTYQVWLSDQRKHFNSLKKNKETGT